MIAVTTLDSMGVTKSTMLVNPLHIHYIEGTDWQPAQSVIHITGRAPIYVTEKIETLTLLLNCWYERMVPHVVPTE